MAPDTGLLASVGGSEELLIDCDMTAGAARRSGDEEITAPILKHNVKWLICLYTRAHLFSAFQIFLLSADLNI